MAEQYVFAHLGFQLADARLRLKTPARQSQLLRRDQSPHPDMAFGVPPWLIGYA
jgi:hypothetical protein